MAGLLRRSTACGADTEFGRELPKGLDRVLVGYFGLAVHESHPEIVDEKLRVVGAQELHAATVVNPVILPCAFSAPYSKPISP